MFTGMIELLFCRLHGKILMEFAIAYIVYMCAIRSIVVIERIWFEFWIFIKHENKKQSNDDLESNQ